MDEVGRQLRQRDEHKAPQVQPGMGNGEFRRGQHLIAIEQQIKINRSGQSARDSITPHRPFNFKTSPDELDWRERRLQFDDPINKPMCGIVGRPRSVLHPINDRLRLIPGRSTAHGCVGQHGETGHRLFALRESIAKICANGDVAKSLCLCSHCLIP